MNAFRSHESTRSASRARCWWWAIPIIGALSIPAIWSSGGQRASAAIPAAHADGVLCTTSASPNATFVLTTRPGRIHLPDGNSVAMWGLAAGAGGFQYPGPVLCVNQGDTVTVILHNTLAVPTSLIFPGQENVTADGLPSGPQFTATNLTSLAKAAPASGGAVTYRFVASRPGTFLYESGTDQAVQVNMGLVGGIVVRPTAAAGTAYGTPATAFNPQTEYLLLLSEIDPEMHRAIERGSPFDITDYHAHYWLVNGRSFPDTIAENNASWLPGQPQGSLVRFQPKDASNPLPALVRYISVGAEPYPFHPHGNHGRVVARDGYELRDAGADLSYEKFTVDVGPGQTLDALYDFTDIEQWSQSTNPIPVYGRDTVLQNLLFKGAATYYSGSPYLGQQDDLPVGTTSFNQCGEYYHFMHSHALNQVSNFGISGGGMLTLMRIDPPTSTPSYARCHG